MSTATLPSKAFSSVDTGVLLEAGTNEVEILVFHVAHQRFGVNVAKVREVRAPGTITRLPRYPEAVHGVIRVRDSVVPLVDLEKHLWGRAQEGVEEAENDLFLEFNNRMIAFRVHGIERIFRVSWKDLIPLPECPGLEGPITGLLLLDGKVVSILDFESIGSLLGINGDVLSVVNQTAKNGRNREACPIVFADDSPLLRRMIGKALAQTGYTQVAGFSDGQEAWDYLTKVAESTPADEIPNVVGCVVSDIEMPRMDGFTLTRHIRENAVLRDVPVILFSSLVSRDNEKKGKQVGATAQISKPQWEDLTATLTHVLAEVVG
jgi:two-component system, chemotaxis family, chemotaxis protein CheV